MYPQSEISYRKDKYLPLLRVVHGAVDGFIGLILYLGTAFFMDSFVVSFKSNFLYYTYLALLALLVYILYYTIMEFKFQKTIGKFLTRTRVVSAAGTRPPLKSIWIRSFIRLVPFEWISLIFKNQCLHDILSQTYVVKERDA